MSLDKLAVIFIIIILPISLALNVYTDYQAKTLNLQSSYDAKLNTATSDALKAYQLNAFNESTSNLSVSKMRDISAAANTFINSISTNFNMDGYSKDSIQNYIPALVFTMYDGFYIYSKYDNTLSEDDYKERYYDAASGTWIEESTYKNGQELYGLKPFISYSCRYQRGEEDFVISYSLDNYISIQGKVKVGSEIKWINDAGYLIDIDDKKIEYNPKNSYIKYRGKTIAKEDIQWETVGKDRYRYKKINGVKYYYDENHVNSRGDSDPKWFSLLNGDKNYINAKYNLDSDYSAYNYYKDAYDFTKRVRDIYGLANLKPTDAYGIVEEKQDDGTFIVKQVPLVNELNQADSNVRIFGSDFAKGIEEPTSNFNEHRLAVIKYIIQKELSIAIKNYNKYSPVGADFQMPKLEESEWDKILNNITLISFLQGLPIGGKIYNGCSVVANNKNDEVVTEKSIYIGVNNDGTEDNYYYSPLYKSFPSGKALTGIFNVDLERRSIESGDASIEPDNYYPKYYLAAYDSIVSPVGNANISSEKTDVGNGLFAYNDNIYTYMDNNASQEVATTYYTALGRERNSTYKINAPYKIPNEVKIYGNNSHKYLLYDTSSLNTFNNDEVTWDNAEAYCESLGGHLVTINSDQEKEFLVNNFGINDTSKAYWIGKKDNQLITNELNEITDVYSGRQCYDGTLHYFICEWE